MKGVSPLVATALLIAFTIGVAATLSFWLIPYLKKISEQTSQQTDIQLICSRGGVSFTDLVYNLTTSSLSGKIENSGSVVLGNFSMRVIYTNYSFSSFDLCLSGNEIIACDHSNLSLLPREKVAFNLSLEQNFDTITLTTNCSAYGVYAEVKRSEILSGY